MNYKKFKKKISKYFDVNTIELPLHSKYEFNVFVKSIYEQTENAPHFQVQYDKSEKLWWVGGVSAKSLDLAFIKWLEGNRGHLDFDRSWYKKRESMFSKMWYEEYIKCWFNRIVQENDITTVNFANGKKVSVKRTKYARNDIYTAVAFAITKQLFGSNHQYQKQVDKWLEGKK